MFFPYLWLFSLFPNLFFSPHLLFCFFSMKLINKRRKYKYFQIDLWSASSIFGSFSNLQLVGSCPGSNDGKKSRDTSLNIFHSVEIYTFFIYIFLTSVPVRWPDGLADVHCRLRTGPSSPVHHLHPPPRSNIFFFTCHRGPVLWIRI